MEGDENSSSWSAGAQRAEMEKMLEEAQEASG